MTITEQRPRTEHHVDHSPAEFTEAQMTAIDQGVVKAYFKTRRYLPPVLQSAGRGDPADVLRAFAYDYARGHRADIDSREPWQIRHHIYGRCVQHVARVGEAQRLEVPVGAGPNLERGITKAAKAATIARPSPPKKIFPEAAFESRAGLDALHRYGRMIPQDQLQFVITGHRDGRPVFETPERMAALHTRKPTRMEFWFEVCDEPDRKKFRKQIAESFAAGICACDECTAPNPES